MITNWCMLLGLLICVNVGIKFSSSMPMAIARGNNDVLYATQDGAIFTDLNQPNGGSQNEDEYEEEEVVEYVPVPKKKSTDDTLKDLVHRVGRFFANEPKQAASADPFNGVNTDNSNNWGMPTLFKKNLLDGAQELSKKIDSFYPENSTENQDQDYGAAMNQMFGDESNLSNEGKVPAKNAHSTGYVDGEDYADYLRKLLDETEIPPPVQETPKENILTKPLNAIKRVPSAVNNFASNLGKKTPPSDTVDQEQDYGVDLQNLYSDSVNPDVPSKNGFVPELQKSFKKVPDSLKPWMPSFGKQNNRGGADGQDLLNLSPTYDSNDQTATKGIDNNESDQLNLEIRATNPETSGAGPGKGLPSIEPWEQLLKELDKMKNPNGPKGPSAPAAQEPTKSNDIPKANDPLSASNPDTHFPLNNSWFTPRPPLKEPSTEQPNKPLPEKSSPSKTPLINPNDAFQPANAPSDSNPLPSSTPTKPTNEPPPATKPSAAKPSATKPAIDPGNVFEPTTAVPQPATPPKSTSQSPKLPRSPPTQEPPSEIEKDPFGVDPFAGLFDDVEEPPLSPAKTSPSTPKKPEDEPTQKPVKPSSPGIQSPKPQVQPKPTSDPLNPNNLFEDVPQSKLPVKPPTYPTKAGTSPPTPKQENPEQQQAKTPPPAKTFIPNLPSELVPSRSKPPSAQSAPPVKPVQEPSAKEPTSPKLKPTGKPTINPDDIIVPASEPVPTQAVQKPPISELPPTPRPLLPKSASMPPLRAPADQPQPSPPPSPKPRAPERQTSTPAPSALKPLPTSPLRPQRIPSKPLLPFSDEDEDNSVPIDQLSPALQKMARPPPTSTVPDPKRLLQPSQTTKPQPTSTVPDPKRLLKPNQTTKQQPTLTDSPSKNPLRLKPTNSRLPEDVDPNDDEMVDIPISRYGGIPQEKQGFWARYFGIKWTPLGEVLMPGLLDPTKRLSGTVGMPAVAGLVPGAQVAGMGAKAIQQITGLPQVYENPSDSGRWGRYIAGAFALAGLG